MTKPRSWNSISSKAQDETIDYLSMLVEVISHHNKEGSEALDAALYSLLIHTRFPDEALVFEGWLYYGHWYVVDFADDFSSITAINFNRDGGDNSKTEERVFSKDEFLLECSTYTSESEIFMEMVRASLK